MPDPFICYATPGGKALGDLRQALERVKFVPTKVLFEEGPLGKAPRKQQ
jgi:hypothetical protein